MRGTQDLTFRGRGLGIGIGVGIGVGLVSMTLGACSSTDDGTTATAAETPETGDSETSTAPDPETETSAATTETSDESETSAGEDLPPSVELFVNGTSMPPLFEVSQAVALSADASDDDAIERVDFYLDNTLVGSDDSEPYEATALLTSIDNGPHAFRAQAYDSANQSSESQVDVAVSIEGGALIASDANLFQMGGLAIHPGLGIVSMRDDSVTIVGTLAVGMFDVTGLGAINLTADLEQINWQLSVPEALVDGEQQYLTFGQPSLSADGQRIWIAGNRFSQQGGLNDNIVLMSVAADGSMIFPFLEFATQEGQTNLGIAGMDVNADSELLMAGPDTYITKLDEEGLIWQSEVGEPWKLSWTGGVRIQADNAGGAIFDSYVCNGPCRLRTARINGFDGNELWSDTVPANPDFYLLVGASAVGPNNEVVTLNGPALDNGGGLKMTLRDEDGVVLESATVGDLGDSYFVGDAAFDAQGGIVVAGGYSTEDEPDVIAPFVARLSAEGDLLWEEGLDMGGSPDLAMGLELDRNGQVYVVGVSSVTPLFVSFVGDAWIARLSL